MNLDELDGRIGEGWGGLSPNGAHVNVVLARRGSATAAAAIGMFAHPAPGHTPILVCVGILFMAFAAIPFPGVVRIGLLVVGVIFFILAIAGWMLEDVKLFPKDDPAGGGHH